MKYLLLDTNIYLHYVDFEQIDWGTIINDTEYTIVVPYTVIKEIDKHKDGLKSKIKNRAKSISAKFGDYFLDENNSKKMNVITLDEPSDELLSTHDLNRSICDDVIIGSALAFDHRDEIIVISHDNTLLIKAKKFGLKYLSKMPDKYLIAEEKSEEEKELEKYRKELMQLKNRQPKPLLTFANGETVLRIKSPNLQDVDQKLCEIMAEIMAEHPHAHKSTSKINKPIGINNISEFLSSCSDNIRYAMFSDEQLDKYNKELDKYYAYCKRYHRFVLEKQNLEKQVRQLQFTLINDGSAETGEMNIFLDFPEKVKLYNRQCVKQIDDLKPKAPYIGSQFCELDLGLSMRYINPGGGLNIPQLYCWDLTNSLSKHHFALTSESLIHKVKRTLCSKEPLYVDTKQCGNFAINWKICAAGTVNHTSGTLNVIIETE